MTYNFYLKDGADSGAVWGEGTRYVVGNELKRMFDEVCALPARAYSISDYGWDPRRRGYLVSVAASLRATGGGVHRPVAGLSNLWTPATPIE